MTLQVPSEPVLQQDRIAAHYRLVAPLIASVFHGTPIVYGSYPKGMDQPIVWTGPIRHALPAGVETVTVALPHAHAQYLKLSANEIEWIAQNAGAVEIHGWACTAEDPLRARFGRILMELDAQDDPAALPAAAHLLRAQLNESGLYAIPLLSGTNGIALWIPLDDAPTYPDLRARLHAFCSEAVRRNPARFSTEPNTHASGRVHLHVSSNAPGRYSALPYCLRGDEQLHVCAPVFWHELGVIADGSITAANLAQRLAEDGDAFALQLGTLQNQRMVLAEPHAKPVEPHGRVLRAALEILEDGRPREAKEILTEAIARELLPPSTLAKYVYTSLLEYIVRTSGHGHKPAIVQDHDRRFRINQTPDEWPTVEPHSAPAIPPQTQSLIDRLEQTQRGSDPAAYELAVCDAFAHLGFAATHVGGNENPDGYADAQLGVLGYRVMIECKTAAGDVTDPDAVEASKYKQPYSAQYALIIGPSYTEDTQFSSELQVHGVSAWTTADLQRLLASASNPYEMLPLFAPGFAADGIDAMLWDRIHGRRKRLQIICNYLQQAGWDAQVSAAKQGPPANAPRLTIDAAMLLVDQRLADAGSSASCTREDVQSAFDYITNPRIAIAVWTDTSHTAVSIIQAPLA